MFPFSDEDLLPAVTSILADKIEPMLKKDNGGIKLIKIENAIVYVQLQGACIGCSSSGTTLKFIVEKGLKEAIHPELKIVNVPIGMENRIMELS